MTNIYIYIYQSLSSLRTIVENKEAYRRNLCTIQKEKERERNKDSRLTGFPTTKRNYLDREERESKVASYLFEREKRTVRGHLFARDFDTLAGRRRGEVVGIAGSYVNNTIRYCLRTETVYSTQLCIFTRTWLERENQGHGEIISINFEERTVYLNIYIFKRIFFFDTLHVHRRSIK